MFGVKNNNASMFNVFIGIVYNFTTHFQLIY